MSDVYGGFAVLDRDEAERLRRELDDLRAALATVTLDRDVWRAQAEAAVRERDEARAAIGLLRTVARELVSWDWHHLLVDHPDAESVKDDSRRVEAVLAEMEHDEAKEHGDE